MGSSIVAGVNAAPVHEFTEHVLDKGYVEACKTTEKEPDEDLLGPIIDSLEQIKANQTGDEDGTEFD